MKRRMLRLKNEQGFTIMEMILVLAIITILISVTVMSLSGYSDHNAAVKVKQEASNALDVSKGYLLSTASPEKAELTTRLEKLLEGYTIQVFDDRHFIITYDTLTGEWLIELVNKVDEGLMLRAVIRPAKNETKIQGISGDVERIRRLVEEGVIDG